MRFRLIMEVNSLSSWFVCLCQVNCAFELSQWLSGPWARKLWQSTAHYFTANLQDHCSRLQGAWIHSSHIPGTHPLETVQIFRHVYASFFILHPCQYLFFVILTIRLILLLQVCHWILVTTFAGSQSFTKNEHKKEKRKRCVLQSLVEVWIGISHYLQKTPSPRCSKKGLQTDTLLSQSRHKIGERRAGKISGRPVMTSCLGNCIRQPNIKALNFQGALRWQVMYKWMISPWVNTHWIEPCGTVRRKKLHAREHLADWTTWFNMTGGDEINKRRIDFQDKAGVITLLDCNISRHF